MIGYIVDCILCLLKLFNNVETVEDNSYLFHVIFILFLDRIRADVMADLMDHAHCLFFETILQVIDDFLNIFAGIVFVLQLFENVVEDIDEVEHIDNGEWIVECDIESRYKFVELFVSDEFVEEVWFFYHEMKDSQVEEIYVDLILA